MDGATDVFRRDPARHHGNDLVDELPHLTVVRDPNDDMVIATAVRAQAAYIVTRDRDLLSLQHHEGITMITPEAFIAIVRERGRLRQ